MSDKPEALEPIEDVVKRGAGGWGESLYNCTTGANYLRMSEYYRLIRDLDAWERENAELKAQLAARPEEQRRVLFEEDAYCPSCGHNRDKSSVSTIDHQDGTRSCQLCGTRWLEVPSPMNNDGRNG
jgi:hypothetical protein